MHKGDVVVAKNIIYWSSPTWCSLMVEQMQADSITEETQSKVESRAKMVTALRW